MELQMKAVIFNVSGALVLHFSIWPPLLASGISDTLYVLSNGLLFNFHNILRS